MAADPAFRDWWATYLRMGASPGAALALTRMNAEIDIRDVLPSIRVPTLVLHRRHDQLPEGRGRPLRRLPDPRRALRRAAGRGSPAVCRRSGRHPRRDRAVPDRRARRRHAAAARSRARHDPARARRRRRRRPHFSTMPRASASGSAAGRCRAPKASSSPRSTARRARSAAPSALTDAGSRFAVARPCRPAHRRVLDRRRRGFRAAPRSRLGHRLPRGGRRGPRLPHRPRHRRRRGSAVRRSRRAPDSRDGGVAAVQGLRAARPFLEWLPSGVR